MNSNIIGIVAGILTTASFLPQVIKIFTVKETKDLSLITFLMLFTGVVLWLIYGLLIKAIPVIAANAITSIFVLAILVMKIRHG